MCDGIMGYTLAGRRCLRCGKFKSEEVVEIHSIPRTPEAREIRRLTEEIARLRDVVNEKAKPPPPDCAECGHPYGSHATLRGARDEVIEDMCLDADCRCRGYTAGRGSEGGAK